MRRRCSGAREHDALRGAREQHDRCDQPELVQVDAKRLGARQAELADAELASEIYSTAGDFDLLVKFYVEEKTDIGHFVNEKVQTIAGIQDTRTIITFKAF